MPEAAAAMVFVQVVSEVVVVLVIDMPISRIMDVEVDPSRDWGMTREQALERTGRLYVVSSGGCLFLLGGGR